MAPDAVQPLRIQKSPEKVSRPLSEVSPMGIRRNSPSFNVATKNLSCGGDSSPFDASPASNSPRLFWKGRESDSPIRFGGSENAPPRSSGASARRNSLEKLQKASRVKNSNMFALETSKNFDPDTSSLLERSLVGSRLHEGQHSNFVKSGQSPAKGHRRTESSTNVPLQSPKKSEIPSAVVSPSNRPNSPHKSSLTSHSRYALPGSFDPDDSIWSDDGDEGSGTPRALRQAKTVSFDAAPPQINEYEMITPDPSSVASGSRESSYDSDSFDMDAAFQRENSAEREDSFDESLEDMGKTPVVLPEDWRFMSPEVANTDLTEPLEDPFEDAEPTATVKLDANMLHSTDSSMDRSNSVASNGERRPLPPLPPSRISSETKDLNSEVQQIKPTPVTPQAPQISKSDVANISASSKPLHEGLRHLTLKEHSKNMLNGEKEGQRVDFTNDEGVGNFQNSSLADAKPALMMQDEPPRISRESILRSIQDDDLNENGGAIELDTKPEDFMDTAQHRNSTKEDAGFAVLTGVDASNIDYANLDPDVAIPSREASSTYEETNQVFVPTLNGKEVMCQELDQEHEPNDDFFNFGSMPALQYLSRSTRSTSTEFAKESSVIRHEIHQDIDISEESDAPQISESDRGLIKGAFKSELQQSMSSDSVSIDPIPGSVVQDDLDADQNNGNLLDFSTLNGGEDLGLSFHLYQKLEPAQTYEGFHTDQGSNSPRRPETPSRPEPSTVFTDEDGIATPESVIHHEIVTKDEVESNSESSHEEIVTVVPEPVATVKASGGKLKTRPSASVADLEAIRAEAFHTSDEQPPPIPGQYLQPDSSDRQNSTLEESSFESSNDNPTEKASSSTRRKSGKMSLDVPLTAVNDELGEGISQEFDRLLEAQKKGYLMRQNTKVVVASNRNASNEQKSHDNGRTYSKNKDNEKSVGISTATCETRKPSGPTYTTEPWNGKMRRHSTRRSIIAPERGLSVGSCPPLPGQDSNAVNALNPLAEDEMSMLDSMDGEIERGRLFVKVIGVKGLQLPLPRREKTWFQLTLDNGLHCVTTAWLELGKSAPIGQEFELTVFDELDFSLTLQTKLERPRSQASQTSQTSSLCSPTKKAKTSALSRFLTSPKKRREAEKRQQEEEAQAAKQRLQEQEAQRALQEPSAWDLLHDLVGSDGSFARAIVDLAEHESRAFGKPYSVDVPCFNEWATEESLTGNSTRSKHGGIQRKPPYKIGDLELQMLYIPKPRGVKDEEMPQSMSACIRQLAEAETCATKQWEGHLSQQGGDCPYWRRRFFRLNGSNLSSYHETTRQRRANINLGKATKLIDDKSSLTQSNAPPSKSGKGRRKSAFAEDEEGYMFVEEGFRIRFANGEVIDFYADNRKEKDEWMKVLAGIVGKDISAQKTTWTTAVLARQREEAKMNQLGDMETAIAAPASAQQTSRYGSKSVPTTPMKSVKPPNLPPKDSKQANSPAKGNKMSRNSERLPLPQEKSLKPKEAASPSKSSPTKRHSGLPTSRASNVTPAARPRQQAVNGRRQAVRSMIF